MEEVTGSLQKVAEPKLTAIDVSEVSRQYSVYILHGIRAGFTPKVNSALNQTVDWRTKLDIALAFRPTLSTSSIKEGDSAKDDRMCGRAGIVLAHGNILGASRMDEGTAAMGLHKRDMPTNMTTTQLDQAILGNRIGVGTVGRGYNELVVDSPIPAGLYLCLDNIGGGIVKHDLPDIKVLLQSSIEYNIPLYILINGSLYDFGALTQERIDNLRSAISAGDVSDTSTVIQGMGGKPITHSKIGDSAWEGDATLLQTQRERLLSAEIFDVGRMVHRIPDAWDMMSYGHGKEAYMDLVVSRDPLKYREMLESDGRSSAFVNISAVHDYKVSGGKLRDRTRNFRTNDTYDRLAGPGILTSGMIWIGNGTYSLDQEITDKRTYMSAMASRLETLSGRPDSAWQINNMCFHLYGFAEQAGLMGNTELKSEIISMIKEYGELARIESIKVERIKSDGSFILREEDLN